MKKIRVVAVCVVLIGMSSKAMARPLIIGDGTPASCTELAVRNALLVVQSLDSGHITFDCGVDPVTIELSSTVPFPALEWVALLPPNNTKIDGGGLITLAFVGLAGDLLIVDANTTVTLQNLTLRGIVANLGTLVMKGVTLAGSVDRELQNFGTLTLRDSTVGHQSVMDTPVENRGQMTVVGTRFFNNGGLSGPLVNIGGTLDVKDSTFSENFGDESGGIVNWGGAVTVNDCDFSHNGGFDASAIISSGGSLTVLNSTFSDNEGTGPGAAISAGPGTTRVKHSRFYRNRGFFSGAINNSGTLTVRNSTFSGNLGGFGAAIYSSNGGLTVIDSHLTSNVASVAGGGIYLDFSSPDFHPSLRLKRTEVSGNSPDDIFPIQ